MGQVIEKDLRDYCELCTENHNTDVIDYKPQRWKETFNSNQLIKFFKDKDILKAFLESVINDNVYCEYSQDLRIKLGDINFDEKFQIGKEENNETAKTDICIKNKDFICIIENKFGSKNRNNQCQRYIKYVFENYPKYKKMFIYLDNEHNGVKVSDSKFLADTNVFGGYYKAMFSHNVLKTLEKFTDNSKYGSDIEQYCKYLRETTLDLESDLAIEIENRRNKLLEIIKKAVVKYNDYDDAIYLDDKLFLDKFEYVNLMLKNNKEIQEYINQKLKNF